MPLFISEKSCLAVGQFGCPQRILQQHGDRHRPHPTGNRRDHRSDFLGLIVRHITNPFIAFFIVCVHFIGADIDSNWQRLLGRDASARGVQRQFPDRDAYAVCSEIAQSQDSLSIRNHDDANVLVGPVSQDFTDLAPVRRGEKQPADGPARLQLRVKAWNAAEVSG